LVALRASCDSDPFGIHELEWAVVEPKANEALAERLAGWQERYPDVRLRRVVVFDRPAHHLVEQAKTARLVAVGTRGHGECAGLLLGSVSAAVVQATRTHRSSSPAGARSLTDSTDTAATGNPVTVMPRVGQKPARRTPE
jgi:hypothetical protein